MDSQEIPVHVTAPDLIPPPLPTEQPDLPSGDGQSRVPTPKVAAAGIGGSVSVVLIWAVKYFWNVDVPPEIAAAIAAIVSFLAGYIKKS